MDPLNFDVTLDSAAGGGTVAPDDRPRVVTLPADLAAAIDEAGVRDRWDRLSYSHQRENVEAVESAKKPETRQRRIQGVITRLS